MTRQTLVALWQFAEQVPTGSKTYEEIKAVFLEELKAGIKKRESRSVKND